MSSTRVDEELAALRALVEDQRRRLEAIEGQAPHLNGNGDRHSRRDLLRLAGAGIVGAAGAAALTAIPAAAATGGTFTLGAANQADNISTLQLTADANASSIANRYAFQADATNQGATGRTGNIHGLEGIGLNSGAGLAAVSSSGPGAVLGSQTGPDLQLGGALVNKQTAGSGRLAQIMRSEVGATGANYTAGSGIPELVRGTDASLWVSTLGTSSTTAANWRRMNSLRVDKADGSGTPFPVTRVLDTRSASGPTAGAPLAAGTTHTFGPFTGVPSDALGIVGNLTVVGFTGAGYVALFPGGMAWPGNSSLNFGGEFAGTGWANAFVVGFGSGANAGKVSVYVSANGITVHVILDVTGYLQ